MSTQRYTAVCRRVGNWWAVDVAELRGVHTQARRLDQVEAMTREAIALTRDIAPDSFDVVVDARLDDDIARTVSAATDASRRARQAAEEASRLQRGAASALLGKYRLTVRDAGTLLQVSPQRVSQLTKPETKADAIGTRRPGSGRRTSRTSR